MIEKRNGRLVLCPLVTTKGYRWVVTRGHKTAFWWQINGLTSKRVFPSCQRLVDKKGKDGLVNGSSMERWHEDHPSIVSSLPVNATGVGRKGRHLLSSACLVSAGWRRCCQVDPTLWSTVSIIDQLLTYRKLVVDNRKVLLDPLFVFVMMVCPQLFGF